MIKIIQGGIKISGQKQGAQPGCHKGDQKPSDKTKTKSKIMCFISLHQISRSVQNRKKIGFGIIQNQKRKRCKRHGEIYDRRGTYKHAQKRGFNLESPDKQEQSAHIYGYADQSKRKSAQNKLPADGQRKKPIGEADCSVGGSGICQGKDAEMEIQENSQICYKGKKNKKCRGGEK